MKKISNCCSKETVPNKFNYWNKENFICLECEKPCFLIEEEEKQNFSSLTKKIILLSITTILTALIFGDNIIFFTSYFLWIFFILKFLFKNKIL